MMDIVDLGPADEETLDEILIKLNVLLAAGGLPVRLGDCRRWLEEHQIETGRG
jgi:hypothetical protein